jgi:hypothetical protein
MASKLADVRDEGLLDCISCAVSIVAIPTKKLKLVDKAPLWEDV